MSASKELDYVELFDDLEVAGHGADVEAWVTIANSSSDDERSMAFFFAHLGVGEARAYRAWAKSMGFESIG
jgi:hypothetical protein